jgi:hypothetical protein
MSQALCVSRLNDRKSRNEDRTKHELQHFLQIFPTVLSALLFS